MSDYFKNTELAARYNISEGTIRNWIKSTRQGKLKLELVEYENHWYVANSVGNIPTIQELIKQNRKYRNTRSAKTVFPRQELFRTFTEAQIHDIVRNLELHHEIPRQYGYFGRGAVEWDEYINKQASADAPSLLRHTIKLLSANYSYLDARLGGFKKVNVIDIGVGNALPVKDLLGHLMSQDKLGRYVALDFSEGMLDIAKRNLQEWFGNRLKFEKHQLDIAHERFTDIVNNYSKSDRDTVNLILFLGATPTNLRVPRDAFRTICESMNPRDLLVYTDFVRPSGSIPEWLEHSYDVKPPRPEILNRHKFVLEQFGVQESYYIAEVGYDSNTNQNYSRAKLKFALNIKLKFNGGEREVQFEKGDRITLWRCWRATQSNIIKLLEDTGFYVTHTSQSEDHNYILTIAEVQPSKWNS